MKKESDKIWSKQIIKYVSLFENKQFRTDWNHFASARLIRKANLYVIGSNWDCRYPQYVGRLQNPQ